MDEMKTAYRRIVGATRQRGFGDPIRGNGFPAENRVIAGIAPRISNQPKSHMRQRDEQGALRTLYASWELLPYDFNMPVAVLSRVMATVERTIAYSEEVILSEVTNAAIDPAYGVRETVDFDGFVSPEEYWNMPASTTTASDVPWALAEAPATDLRMDVRMMSPERLEALLIRYWYACSVTTFGPYQEIVHDDKKNGDEQVEYKPVHLSEEFMGPFAPPGPEARPTGSLTIVLSRSGDPEQQVRELRAFVRHVLLDKLPSCMRGTMSASGPVPKSDLPRYTYSALKTIFQDDVNSHGSLLHADLTRPDGENDALDVNNEERALFREVMDDPIGLTHVPYISGMREAAGDMLYARFCADWNLLYALHMLKAVQAANTPVAYMLMWLRWTMQLMCERHGVSRKLAVALLHNAQAEMLEFFDRGGLEMRPDGGILRFIMELQLLTPNGDACAPGYARLVAYCQGPAEPFFADVVNDQPVIVQFAGGLMQTGDLPPEEVAQRFAPALKEILWTHYSGGRLDETHRDLLNQAFLQEPPLNEIVAEYIQNEMKLFAERNVAWNGSVSYRVFLLPLIARFMQGELAQTIAAVASENKNRAMEQSTIEVISKTVQTLSLLPETRERSLNCVSNYVCESFFNYDYISDVRALAENLHMPMDRAVQGILKRCVDEGRQLRSDGEDSELSCLMMLLTLSRDDETAPFSESLASAIRSYCSDVLFAQNDFLTEAECELVRLVQANDGMQQAWVGYVNNLFWQNPDMPRIHAMCDVLPLPVNKTTQAVLAYAVNNRGKNGERIAEDGLRLLYDFAGGASNMEAYAAYKAYAQKVLLTQRELLNDLEIAWLSECAVDEQLQKSWTDYVIEQILHGDDMKQLRSVCERVGFSTTDAANDLLERPGLHLPGEAVEMLFSADNREICKAYINYITRLLTEDQRVILEDEELEYLRIAAGKVGRTDELNTALTEYGSRLMRVGEMERASRLSRLTAFAVAPAIIRLVQGFIDRDERMSNDEQLNSVITQLESDNHNRELQRVVRDYVTTILIESKKPGSSGVVILNEAECRMISLACASEQDFSDRWNAYLLRVWDANRLDDAAEMARLTGISAAIAASQLLARTSSGEALNERELETIFGSSGLCPLTMQISENLGGTMRSVEMTLQNELENYIPKHIIAKTKPMYDIEMYMVRCSVSRRGKNVASDMLLAWNDRAARVLNEEYGVQQARTECEGTGLPLNDAAARLISDAAQAMEPERLGDLLGLRDATDARGMQNLNRALTTYFREHVFAEKQHILAQQECRALNQLRGAASSDHEARLRKYLIDAFRECGDDDDRLNAYGAMLGQLEGDLTLVAEELLTSAKRELEKGGRRLTQLQLRVTFRAMRWAECDESWRAYAEAAAEQAAKENDGSFIAWLRAGNELANHVGSEEKQQWTESLTLHYLMERLQRHQATPDAEQFNALVMTSAPDFYGRIAEVRAAYDVAAGRPEGAEQALKLLPWLGNVAEYAALKSVAVNQLRDSLNAAWQDGVAYRAAVEKTVKVYPACGVTRNDLYAESLREAAQAAAQSEADSAVDAMDLAMTYVAEPHDAFETLWNETVHAKFSDGFDRSIRNAASYQEASALCDQVNQLRLTTTLGDSPALQCVRTTGEVLNAIAENSGDEADVMQLIGDSRWKLISMGDYAAQATRYVAEQAKPQSGDGFMQRMAKSALAALNQDGSTDWLRVLKTVCPAWQEMTKGSFEAKNLPLLQSITALLRVLEAGPESWQDDFVAAIRGNAQLNGWLKRVTGSRKAKQYLTGEQIDRLTK